MNVLFECSNTNEKAFLTFIEFLRQYLLQNNRRQRHVQPIFEKSGKRAIIFSQSN